MTGPLQALGVEILLVYGAEIRVARGGRPGIRVTAGYHDGTVLLEAVGFPACTEGVAAIREAHKACVAAGLDVKLAPPRMSNHPARIVRRGS